MDRIRAIEVAGLRVFDRVRLDLSPLTALIGPNGSGKSTLVEACALLSAASESGRWLRERFEGIHGGLHALRRGSKGPVALATEIEGGGEALRYEISVEDGPRGSRIGREELTGLESGRVYLRRVDGGGAEAWMEAASRTESFGFAGETELYLPVFAAPSPSSALDRMRAALRAVRVHHGWNVAPTWWARLHDWHVPAREGETLVLADQLAPTGNDIASVWHHLHATCAPKEFDEYLDLVRLGLGQQVKLVGTPADTAGGRVALRLLLHGGRALTASQLSDGQLSWLMWVALLATPADAGGLLVLDEPEQHLHPALFGYLVDLMVRRSATTPVLFATHADALLDAMEEPATSTRVLDLDADGAASVRRLDADALDAWLEHYAGAGSIRAAGLLADVVDRST